MLPPNTTQAQTAAPVDHQQRDRCVLATIGPQRVITRNDNDLRSRIERRNADLRRLALRWDHLSRTVGSPAATPMLAIVRATG
jgi:hypothetical protein